MLKNVIKVVTVQFLLSCFVICQAQNTNIQGVILDEHNKPIENVGIYIMDSTIVALTNGDGLFTLYNLKSGDTIYASHLAYDNVIHIIDNQDVEDKIVIKMQLSQMLLPEIEIVGNAPHVAYDNKVVSVKDFEINERGIYLIAQRRRNVALLHLNFTCDTLKELKINNNYYNIFKDVFGEMHIVSDNDVRQIGHRTFKGGFFEMELMDCIPLNTFLRIFQNVACATDSVIVSGRYFFYDQEIYYYSFKINGDKKPVPLYHVVNEEGRDLYFNVMKFGGFGNADFLFFKPTYDPVFAYDNKLYLFSFDEDKLLVFNKIGEKTDERPLVFHKYRHWSGKMKVIQKWNRKVILDEARGVFYTTSVEDGITTLKKINLDEGTSETVAVFGGFPFIENLRIYNGKAYFLFKNDSSRNSRLYEVALE